MRGIRGRVAALEAALCQLTPYEEMDPISQAVADYVNELEALAAPEAKAGYCEKYGLTPEQLEHHIRALTLDF